MVIGAGTSHQLRLGNSNVPEEFLENDTNVLQFVPFGMREPNLQMGGATIKKFHEEAVDLERGTYMVRAG